MLCHPVHPRLGHPEDVRASSGEEARRDSQDRFQVEASQAPGKFSASSVRKSEAKGAGDGRRRRDLRRHQEALRRGQQQQLLSGRGSSRLGQEAAALHELRSRGFVPQPRKQKCQLQETRLMLDGPMSSIFLRSDGSRRRRCLPDFFVVNVSIA